MSKFETYYREIRQRQSELSGQFPDGCCCVTRAGCVTEVPISIAARLIVEQSHVLASEAEIEEFHAAMQLNRVSTPQTDTLANARAQFAVLMAAKKGERK